MNKKIVGLIPCLGFCFFIVVIFVGCHKQKTVEAQITQPDSDDTTLAISDDVLLKEPLLKEIAFEPLTNDETLKHEIKNDGVNIYLKIFATDNNERELLFVKTVYSHNYEMEIQYSDSKRSMVFQCMSNSSDLFELWFLDGEDKNAINIFRSPAPYYFKIDTDCKVICLYDNHESVDVPIFHIYDIYANREIKKIQYEPYRYKGMYPVEMNYKDGVFTIMLSADTADYTIIEIPIDGLEEYRVLESHSWEDVHNRVGGCPSL
jgi:hypothetical protein